MHQYLNLLKDQDLYACLQDSGGRVISFPPITNSECSKVSEATADVLVEVTSGSKLAHAKAAADALLREMLLAGLGKGEGGGRDGRADERIQTGK